MGDHSILFGLLVAGAMALLALGALMSPRLTRLLGARRAYPAVIVASGVAVAGLAAGAIASAGGVSMAWFIVVGLVAAAALVVVHLPVAAS